MAAIRKKLVIVGDGAGMVGVGYGKAKEVPAAIQKGVDEARKNFFRVPMIGETIPHPVQGEAAAPAVAQAIATFFSQKTVRQLQDLSEAHDIPLLAMP